MNEYIDKKQAIDRIASCYCMDCEHSNGILCRACEHQDDMDLIDDMPAADVQPVKRGRWIIADDVEHFIAVCSECGRTEDSRDIKDMPYCHCGARMDLKDGEQNG